MKTTLTRRLRSLLFLLLSVLLTCAPLSLSGCQELLEVPEENSELNLTLPQGGNYSDAINIFKSLYPGVKVNVSYQNTGEASRFKAEIMSGKGPDIVFDSTLSAGDRLDLYKVIKAGAFSDLTPLIQEDSDFHMEEYQPAVMAAGQFQGKQILLPTSYRPMLSLTTQEALNESGFDLESASKNWFGFMEEAVSYLESPESKVPLYADISSGEEFMCAGIPFLDYASDSLSMEHAGQVKEALRLYKSHTAAVPESGNNVIYGAPTPLLQGQAVFMRSVPYMGSSLRALAEAQLHPVLFPWRNADGRKVSFTSEMAGINNASRNKQNAWNFIKVLLSPNFQKASIKEPFYPVHKTALEEQLAGLDEFSGESDELDKLLAEVKALLSEPEAAYSYNLTGYMEIFPYMEDYFSGRAGLDETFETALKKMERYLSE